MHRLTRRARDRIEALRAAVEEPVITDAELAREVDRCENTHGNYCSRHHDLEPILARLRAAQAVVAWYADADNWDVPHPSTDEFETKWNVRILLDKGARARAHLAAVRGEEGG